MLRSQLSTGSAVDLSPAADLVRNQVLLRVIDDLVDGRTPSRQEYQAGLPGYESLVATELDALDATATNLVPTGLLDASAENSRLPCGTLIGRYRIEGKLGEGGMGVVYLAFDTELDRTVVIKMVRPDRLLTPGASDGLKAEARALARLSDDSVCPIFDIVDAESGGLAIVLPFIAGRTLDKLDDASIQDPVSKAPNSPSDAPLLVATRVATRRRLGRTEIFKTVTVVERSARAVAIAHAAGLVHRDLKPANIMLRPNGFPVVMDFGLAINKEAGLDEAMSSRSGSPPYMAPEQISGQGPIGARTDIYALGVVLYELLSGKRPFSGDGGMTQMFERICGGRPQPFSDFATGIPKDLEAVCLKAMHRDQDCRFGSAGEFADELSRFLRGVSTRTSPLGPHRFLMRQARHHPIAAAIVVVALVVIFAFAKTWSKRHEVGESLGLAQAHLEVKEIWETARRENRRLNAEERVIAKSRSGDDPDFDLWIDGDPTDTQAEDRIKRRIREADRSSGTGTALFRPRGIVTTNRPSFLFELPKQRDIEAGLFLRIESEQGTTHHISLGSDAVVTAGTRMRVTLPHNLVLAEGAYSWNLIVPADKTKRRAERRLADPGAAFRVSTPVARDARLASAVETGDPSLDAFLRAVILLREGFLEDAAHLIEGVSAPDHPAFSARLHLLRAAIAEELDDPEAAAAEFAAARALRFNGKER